MNLTELCQELRNWFDRGQKKWTGTFTIANGYLGGVELQAGQYYRLMGSVYNDGVHKCGTYGELVDETFTGAVWAMAVPPAVIALVEEIDDWLTKYSAQLMSPYTSESFGEYSYTKATGATTRNNTDILTWQAVFASKLNRWRKI